MNNLAPSPPPAAVLTEAVLCHWFGAAAPGDTMTYFRGELARNVCPQLALLEAPERVALAKLASRAWKLAEDGLAHLVQRRHGPDDFEYLIIARPRPRRLTPAILSQILAEAA